MYQDYVLYASIAFVSDGKDAVDGTMPPNTIPRHQGYGSRDILYTLCIYTGYIYVYIFISHLTLHKSHFKLYH